MTGNRPNSRMTDMNFSMRRFPSKALCNLFGTKPASRTASPQSAQNLTLQSNTLILVSLTKLREPSGTRRVHWLFDGFLEECSLCFRASPCCAILPLREIFRIRSLHVLQSCGDLYCFGC